MAITYFAKEGLQGLVIACSCSTSLARHVGLYPGALQGAARPHQAQVCQPFLKFRTVMQQLEEGNLDKITVSSRANAARATLFVRLGIWPQMCTIAPKHMAKHVQRGIRLADQGR